jgi:hypothetical protein
MRSRVQRFRGSRLHSRPWTAFGMVKIDDFHQIYLIPFLFRYKLGAILDFRIFNENFGSLMPSLSLTLNVEP